MIRRTTERKDIRNTNGQLIGIAFYHFNHPTWEGGPTAATTCRYAYLSKECMPNGVIRRVWTTREGRAYMSAYFYPRNRKEGEDNGTSA